ncbi:MAG: adenine phosphoribosyltransferase [Acholeplasmatales bacterium]|nr:adenine phosphoribosyltransferase [Acholeplasmatales bacterium]
MELEKYIADVNDFPKKGILFKDITPLMSNGEAFQFTVEKFIAFAKQLHTTVVMGPEARGFIFGCPVSYALGIGFVPVRKPGKLPREVVSVDYQLEYGVNTLCIHKDSIKPGDRVLIVDDLLATGGTVKATIDLINKLGGIVVGIAVLIELEELKGRDSLKGYEILSLLKY